MPNGCPIPNAKGMCKPEGSGTCGVLIVGEALGDQELADGGLPFRPWAQAGSVLERAIMRIGCTREMFRLYNVIPTHPPNNNIKGWETAAIEWGRAYVEEQIARCKPRAILALGATATKAMTGLAGDKLGVSHLTGYVLPPVKPEYPPIIPCFHPSYLRRGKMSHLGVLMRCLRLAMLVAREGRSPVLPPLLNPPAGYITHPTEQIAAAYILDRPTSQYLAYDIETNYSTNEEDAEERWGSIRSIQFSYGPGEGIYLPWREPYIELAKVALASSNPKLTWNGWRFDNPLIRQNGCTINGTNIDLMWAWHHAQPDLPRGLQFASAMQGPTIYTPSHSWAWPWKHLDHQSPQFYGIVDVDVLQWMVSY